MLIISLIELEKSEYHAHAHRLLRECLKKHGITYTADTPLNTGKYGKPSLAEHPELHFNLSHASGIAACMTGDTECGIDCEKVSHYRPNVVKRAFSESERELVMSLPESERSLMFFRLWTLKEAYVKALGIGISYPLSTAEFSIEWGRVVTGITGYEFRQYVLRNGEFVVSVCRKLS